MEVTVRNKDEMLYRIMVAMPGDIIHVKNTTYSLTISDEIHDKYLTMNCNPSKRYKTNLDFLYAKIKRTPLKIWSC